jgi:formamidopyrimidine-DNA glycosylase
MPELPEVEVTRQSFCERIHGARITDVRLGKPLRWPLGVAPESLVERTVGQAARRGKYLWLPLESAGQPAGGLLMHLGMSGSLAFTAAPGLAGAHDHFDLVTTRGTLRLTDPRRFGAVVWSPSTADGMAAKLLSGLGVEPFDAAFDGAHLHAALKRRRVAVKLALLSGDIVVGAGNIYACEALFAAGIDPRTRSDRVSRARCDRLAAAVRDTLAQALALGGSTLRDFRDAHGMEGRFQAQAQVYGRAGQACRCGDAIRRVVQGQGRRFSFRLPKALNLSRPPQGFGVQMFPRVGAKALRYILLQPPQHPERLLPPDVRQPLRRAERLAATLGRRLARPLCRYLGEHDLADGPINDRWPCCARAWPARSLISPSSPISRAASRS